MHLVERGTEKRHFKLFYRHDRRCFAPTLGVLAGSGLIKGVLALCTSLNLLTTESGTYIILNAAADAFSISCLYFGIYCCKSSIQIVSSLWLLQQLSFILRLSVHIVIA